MSNPGPDRLQKKLGGKSGFDKGYIGVQEVKDRPKRSPLKQRNKAVDSNRIINTQKCTGVNQGEVVNTIESKTNSCEFNRNNREMQSLPVKEGALAGSLSTLASQHFSANYDSGGKGFTLGSIGSAPSTGSISNSMSSGSSGLLLGSSPTNHLTKDQKSTGFSLKTLASNHLLDSGKPALSLGSLASSHLSESSGPLKFTSGPPASQLNTEKCDLSLGSLVLNQQESKLSLGSLASNHLASSSDGSSGFTLGSLASSHLGSAQTAGGSNTSQFTIPAIFGHKPQTTQLEDKPKERSVSPEVEIDLMSALKLSTPEQTNIVETSSTKVETVKIDIIVPDISRIMSGLRKRKRTPFSKVITRKWARTEAFQPLKICLPTNSIPVYQFSEPSPDDLVLKAQSQSRAFNRQTSEPAKT